MINSPRSHCLKITQNVTFEFLAFWHFSPTFVLLKLTFLVSLFDRKFQVFKNSPNPKLTFASLAMLNETFSEIFKHCVTGKNLLKIALKFFFCIIACYVFYLNFRAKWNVRTYEFSKWNFWVKNWKCIRKIVSILAWKFNYEFF